MQKRGRVVTSDYGFKEEGITHVIGIDEAGWGAIAGPLLVGGVMCPVDDFLEYLDIKDSKRYNTERAREIAYDNLWRLVVAKQVEAFSWAMSPRDVANSPAEALSIAQRIVIDSLVIDNPDVKAAVITDGNRLIPKVMLPQQAVIEADNKFKVVSAASVIAKVERDRYMREYAQAEYPEFGFSKHKGYATKEHLVALREHGPTVEHRFNIKLVKDALATVGPYEGNLVLDEQI